MMSRLCFAILILILSAGNVAADIVTTIDGCKEIPDRLVKECSDAVATGSTYSWYNPSPKPPHRSTMKLTKDTLKASQIAVSCSVEGHSAEVSEGVLLNMESSGYTLEKFSPKTMVFAKPKGGEIAGMILGELVGNFIGGKTATQMQGPYYTRISFTFVDSGSKTVAFVHQYFVANYGSDKEIQIGQNDLDERVVWIKRALGLSDDRFLTYSYVSPRTNAILYTKSRADIDIVLGSK